MNAIDDKADYAETKANQAYDLANTKLNANANAVSASKLQTPRRITLTGSANGNATFDGTGDITINTTDNLSVGLVTSTSATGTANVATGNTNTYLNIVEKRGSSSNALGSSTKIQGAGSVTVSSDTAGAVTITGSQNVTGNAGTATKLQTARTISLSGAVSGSGTFDGSANVNIPIISNVVTGLVTATTNTGTANEATNNNNTFLNIVETVNGTASSVGSSTKIVGSRGVSVGSDTAGTVTITGPASTSAVNSTSTSYLATAAAVKTAYDKGVEALNVANSKQSPATTLAGYGISDFSVISNLNTTDLNTVKVTGIYGQLANANALAEYNYPVRKAGNLMVLPSAYGYMQIYTTFDTREQYVRNLNSGGTTWSTWLRTDGINKADAATLENNIVTTKPDTTQQNKWAFVELDRAQPYIPHSTIPDYSIFHNNTIREAKYVSEGETFFSSGHTYSYLFYRCIISVSAAKTINFTAFVGDDAHAVYIDKQLVYSRNGFNSTGMTFTADVTAGTHIVDVLIINSMGSVGFKINDNDPASALSAQVDSMYAATLTVDQLSLYGGTVNGKVVISDSDKRLALGTGANKTYVYLQNVDSNNSLRLFDNGRLTYGNQTVAFESGNVATATKLQTPRTITLTGSVSGSATFDGSANVSIATTDNLTVGLVTSTSATGTSNTATTNTNTYLNVIEKRGSSSNALGSSTKITGRNGVSISSDTGGVVYIDGPTSITGNAATATKLATARNIVLTGAVTGSASFDGSRDVSINTTDNLVVSLVTSTSATGTTNVVTSNTNTYLNVVETRGSASNSVGSSTKLVGSRGISVSSDTAGTLTITGMAYSSAVNSTSGSQLATSAAVKTAYDKGVEALTKANENATQIGQIDQALTAILGA